MKALAGMLLAVALAVGIGSEASARTCPSNKRSAKHVTHSKLTKSSNKKSKLLCFCRLTKKKKHHTGVMKTSTYAGFMPSTETQPMPVNLESDMFPSNPLPTPGGEWDNTGSDLRRYPPESHVLGTDVNANPATNSNTNANMNWLESTEQQKNQAEQQKLPDLQNQGGGKQVPTQQQMPTEQMPTEQQNPTEQPKNQ